MISEFDAQWAPICGNSEQEAPKQALVLEYQLAIKRWNADLLVNPISNRCRPEPRRARQQPFADANSVAQKFKFAVGANT
jgi:hypothetical protein